ncbi:MAG: ABC transporter permease [Cyclobacteriaceae bacterium]
MNKKEHITPPKWPLRFLRFFVKKDYLEEIEGDMEEVFQDSLTIHSVKKARRLYVWETVKLLRPIILKELEGASRLNSYGIFKNYLKTSVRSIKRNALFSSINVVGLAISMSVGILMILFLFEIYSFDDFHEQKDRIYRVTSHSGDATSNLAAASPYIAYRLQNEVPGVDKVLILYRNLSADLKTEKEAIAVKGYYASLSFFDVFSFKLKKGNPHTALVNPGAIVLTESTAKKLFGDSDPLGKTITVDNNKNFSSGIITGVMEDPPINSHLDFEALVSFKTVEDKQKNWAVSPVKEPEFFGAAYVYLVLREDAKVEEIELMMTEMLSDYNSRKDRPAMLRQFLTHRLQPMDTFVASPDSYRIPPGPVFLQRKIHMMIGLTFIVILSACFNYTNLSLARALRRSKEISVRKVIGANRFQVFFQFMMEAVLLSLIALILSIGMYLLIKPEFLNLLTYQRFELDVDAYEIMFFLLFAFVVGGIAGFLPALFLSRLKASVRLNDAGKIRLLFGASIRQILIVFQFALSISLIMCAVMVYKQYDFVLHYNLGYETGNIVNVNIKGHGNYGDLLENEYKKIPEVIATSRSTVALGTGKMRGAFVLSEDRADTTGFWSNLIDANYLDMHGIELLAGSGFITPAKKGESRNKVIVNRELLKKLNLGSPEEAIGKTIWFHTSHGGGDRLLIQGVVGDFIGISLNVRPYSEESSKAFMFRQKDPDWDAILGVKIKSTDVLATMNKLEEAYKKIDPVHPFEAKFYDDQIADLYKEQKTTYTIISFLAFLAISISTLGLLGMAVFTTESRMKEISIRKVLGAGIRSLSLLLSKGFLLMMCIAGLIAIPVAIYTVDEMLLSNFLYRADIGVMDVLSGFVIVLLIGILTIGWQIGKAVVQNPADLLRDE